MAEPAYRWVIVAAGGLLGCIAMGAMFSLPVMLLAIAGDTGWSVAGVSSAMTIGFLAMAVGSVVWGTLSDRIGARAVVLIGSALLAGGLALASRSQSLILFQLSFGLLVGASGAAILVPLMASVTGWFETNRSLAVSLVSAGMGMAPMTMSPFTAWLMTWTDWRTAMLWIAGLAAVVMLPAALLIRRPPALAAAVRARAEGAPDHAAAAADADADASLLDIARTPQFAVLLATNLLCCAVHSGPIIHTVSYAVTCGIPLLTAVSIYSVEGLAGMAGRIGFGLVADRLGAKRVLVGGLLLQAFGALAYVFVGQLAAFYAVAATFGFIYAGTMPLYAVLARENFPLRYMGSVIGGTAMAGSLGMAIGPLAGGLIFDASGTYTWMYVMSWALGIASVLVAMLFRPRHEPDAALKPA